MPIPIDRKVPGQQNSFNFPTLADPTVKNSTSVLTSVMMPLASALIDEINIIGADGRKKDEDYYWKHSAASQFNDLMGTVFSTHPSMFRDALYSDQYEQHCAFVNELIRYGESLGKHYYSLTESYVPALSERYKPLPPMPDSRGM